MHQNYLQTLREIKSVAFATNDGEEPHVRIADIMIVENDRIYFTTARGKGFYEQLKANPVVAIVGITPDYKMIRVTGEARVVEKGYLDKIFELNPMMNGLYAGEKRYILEPFCIEKGRGECFDLSAVPPRRERFAFGGAEEVACGYSITDRCTACGLCLEKCLGGAIVEGEIFSIDARICLECGRCAEHCLEGAIEKPTRF